MVKQHLTHDAFEEVKFVSPFISPKLVYKIECPSRPSLKPKLCPSGHSDVVLDNGRNSMLVLYDLSLKHKNFYAMDILLSTMHSYEDHNHLWIFVSKLFKRMVVDAYVYHKYCISCGYVVVLTLQLELQCSMFGGKAGNYHC